MDFLSLDGDKKVALVAYFDERMGSSLSLFSDNAGLFENGNTAVDAARAWWSNTACFLFHDDSSTEFRWTTPQPDTAGLSMG